jgi:ribosomal protein S18 acetylase RimI-like enzyme
MIRDAVAADAGQLAGLIRSAYRGTVSRDGWTSEADLVAGDRTDAQRVLDIITGPHSVMLVLAEDAGIVACCQLEDRGDKLAYFGTFAVRPGIQGGGLGRRLITEAEREAAARFGASAVEMTVLAQQDKLIAWYERLGYQRTGEQRPFPADPVYARPLRDDLYFVVLRKTLPGPAWVVTSDSAG